MLTETQTLQQTLFKEHTQRISYTQPLPGGGISTLNPAKTGELETFNQELLQFVIANDHSCLGAQSVFKTGNYRFGVYDELGNEELAPALYHDIISYLKERSDMHPVFNSFMAIFKQPKELSELDFEKLLWQQLQQIHGVDKQHFEWDPTVSHNPEENNFSFSIGGKAFYIVGMHPNSSRQSRRFKYPMLVFNLHEQFEQLREKEKYDKLKGFVRKRELARQGSINPMLQDFGESKETMQYSGRAVNKDWKCPFHFDK